MGFMIAEVDKSRARPGWKSLYASAVIGARMMQKSVLKTGGIGSAALCALLMVAACGSAQGSQAGGGSTDTASKTITLGADAPETGPESSVLALASGVDAYFKYV